MLDRLPANQRANGEKRNIMNSHNPKSLRITSQSNMFLCRLWTDIGQLGKSVQVLDEHARKAQTDQRV